jgi:hypothetical protein
LNAAVPEVDKQIASYLQEDNLATSLDDMLHVLLFSVYNHDYWWYVYWNYDVSSGPAEPSNIYEWVVNFTIENIETLYEAGATQFLVANAVNMAHEEPARSSAGLPSYISGVTSWYLANYY